MIVAKSFWAAVQGDPVFMRRVNGWLALFWIAMIPISLETGWVKSVVYVSALSLWALVSGHWSAWPFSSGLAATLAMIERPRRRLRVGVFLGGGSVLTETGT